MAKQTAPRKKKQAKVEKRERAMIEGIIEGSPDAVGVVVIRIDCGCRKMAGVQRDGEPASKLIIYRDEAESICDKCKEDNGAFMRVTDSFIHYTEEDLSTNEKKNIEIKVLGQVQTH